MAEGPSWKCQIFPVKWLLVVIVTFFDCLKRDLRGHFGCMIPLRGNNYSSLKCIAAKWDGSVMPRYVTYTAWITSDFARRQTAVHSFTTQLRLGAPDTVNKQPYSSQATVTLSSTWESGREWECFVSGPRSYVTWEEGFIVRAMVIMRVRPVTQCSERNRIAPVFSSCRVEKRSMMVVELSVVTHVCIEGQTVTHLACVREVLCSNFRRDTG